MAATSVRVVGKSHTAGDGIRERLHDAEPCLASVVDVSDEAGVITRTHTHNQTITFSGEKS